MTAGFEDLRDIEQRARACLDASRWAYLSGGAGRDNALEANVQAFDAIRLRPRLARESCAQPSLQTSLFGRVLKFPVLLAPTSPLRLFHPDAELAVARAAARAGVITIVSADSHFPLERIAAAAQGAWWFQIYAYCDFGVVHEMVRLAEETGAEALVVTMDAHFAAHRRNAARSGFTTPNVVDYHLLRRLGVLTGDQPASGRLDRLPLTMADIEAIAAVTDLPLLVKGVLRGEDAAAAVEAGAAGLIVSNHGGRQLDQVVPSMMALEDVIAAVRDKPVLIDSGIRGGADVVKALALGARAACIGRPYIWGLTVGGEDSVVDVLSILRSEIADVLRQMSVASTQDLGVRDVAAWSMSGLHPAAQEGMW